MAREHPVAIVTGGASGIGRALATALVRRGGTVAVADLDGEAAERVAEELRRRGPGHAEAVPLDVRDAAAVAAAYRRVRDEHGRLDLVFNNAGIAVGGLVDELTLDHWNRTIDVNLRGVVHGVQAAYPLLLDQGFGHIVNTASLAGLLPAPLMAPYTATKHAVVGLSLALRAEAAPRGVRVSVVCPGFVDTPLLDRVNAGLPDTPASRSTRQQVRRVQPRLYSADRLAEDVLRGVARNRAVIVAPASARLAARLTRLAPAAVVTAAGIQVRRYLRERAVARAAEARPGG
ncbi:SDR family NAD(P)-dependent oxidoreductase [Carbonactinospora thermoautotrophica]|uniref:SDR family NAD(P)-dependent oxidoreductase n=1 Tax=Carbonactinospora thermoautotrophica TaxID=1469144 RepID=UPI00082B83E3|nr:SDR family oxidoreductase [Carbonactinospora thermoautotrophica]MCX9192659.1 SDR family NAD(P)-dependent oxidoreductase [Carbonactinospora thermoautotrophica]